MLKEKITEQASEHVRLLTENEKLRQDNLNTVSPIIVIFSLKEYQILFFPFSNELRKRNSIKKHKYVVIVV